VLRKKGLKYKKHQCLISPIKRRPGQPHFGSCPGFCSCGKSELLRLFLLLCCFIRIRIVAEYHKFIVQEFGDKIDDHVQHSHHVFIPARTHQHFFQPGGQRREYAVESATSAMALGTFPADWKV